MRLDRRSCGVLLHLTSLPNAQGCGALGEEAHSFVDFLAGASQRWWQTLPVNPIGGGNSPYSGQSAFAGEPLLISLPDLVRRGLLRRGEVPELASTARVQYGRAVKLGERARRLAFSRFSRQPKKYQPQLDEFRARCDFWLSDYVLFRAASLHHQGQSWTQWDAGLARRRPAALNAARRAWDEELAFYEFEQLMFDLQWRALRNHAKRRGVGLIGDVPFFVDHQSADVWAHQPMFRLDRTGRPTHVSGVPPDYFSETGQLWGTPLFRWNVLAQNGYRFWVERMRAQLERFDIVRLDHFIGFARYWEVGAEQPTAIHGRWRPGPGLALFETLARELGGLPFIAEDLGSVNEQVRALRRKLGIPGIRVLQFGFGEGDNEHFPHHYPAHCVAYSATHDSNTLRGWLASEVEPKAVAAYVLGPRARASRTSVPRALMRQLFASAAHTVIAPIQDWLSEGQNARMNVPGTAEGNWTYRLRSGSVTDALADELRAYASTYRRLGQEAPPPSD